MSAMAAAQTMDVVFMSVMERPPWGRRYRASSENQGMYPSHGPSHFSASATVMPLRRA